MRVVYPGCYFLSVISFLGAAEHLDRACQQQRPVSNEVAGIENQIWREYSCNPLINWKFPKLARIKTSCISQGRRGDEVGSGSQVCFDDASDLRVWVVRRLSGGEATCHVSSDDHTLLSGVGGDRGEVVRLDNWAKCDIDFQLNVTSSPGWFFCCSSNQFTECSCFQQLYSSKTCKRRDKETVKTRNWKPFAAALCVVKRRDLTQRNGFHCRGFVLQK